MTKETDVRFRPIVDTSQRWHRCQMDFIIRAATVSDIIPMHRVRSRVRENRLSDPQRITEASYLPYIEADSIWIAETDGAVVGFAAVDEPSKSIWALFIDPDVEGAGIGRALHLQMLRWAREQGLLRLTLSTAQGTRAARFYKRAGWTEVGITRDGEALMEISLLS